MFSITNIMLILTVAMTLIQLVEQLLGSGTGDQKKAAVIEALKKLVADLKITVPAIILDNLGILVDLIVGLYNAFGPFVKSK